MDLALNNLQRLICHKTHPTNQHFLNDTLTKNVPNKKKAPDEIYLTFHIVENELRNETKLKFILFG